MIKSGSEQPIQPKMGRFFSMFGRLFSVIYPDFRLHKLNKDFIVSIFRALNNLPKLIINLVNHKKGNCFKKIENHCSRPCTAQRVILRMKMSSSIFLMTFAPVKGLGASFLRVFLLTG